jgi:hypothetical protein
MPVTVLTHSQVAPSAANSAQEGIDFFAVPHPSSSVYGLP